MLFCVILAAFAAAEDVYLGDFVALEEVPIVAALGRKEVDLLAPNSAAPVIRHNAAIVDKAASFAGPRHRQAIELRHVEGCANLDALGIHGNGAERGQWALGDAGSPRVLLIGDPEARPAAFASAGGRDEPPILEFAAAFHRESALERVAHTGDPLASLVDDGLDAARILRLRRNPVVGHVKLAHGFAEGFGDGLLFHRITSRWWRNSQVDEAKRRDRRFGGWTLIFDRGRVTRLPAGYEKTDEKQPGEAHKGASSLELRLESGRSHWGIRLGADAR